MGESARDFLGRFLTACDNNHGLIEKSDLTRAESDEIELSLGLSLNGCFGVDPNERDKRKLVRSCSIAAFPPFVSATTGESDFPPANGGALMRTSSLPTEEMQSLNLKRLEAKRKRLERRNSIKSGVSSTKESVGERGVEEERAGKIRKVEPQMDGYDGATSAVDFPVVKSQGSCSSVCSSLAEARPLNGVEMNGLTKCTLQRSTSTIETNYKPFPTTLPPTAPGKAPPNCTQTVPNHVKRITGRAHSFGELERSMMLDMPCVSTKGEGPNGKRVEGFLYKYKKGEEVRIVCVCHGSFLTPAEFVRHAGGGDVAHPLRHIVVNPTPASFF